MKKRGKVHKGKKKTNEKRIEKVNESKCLG